MAQQIFYAEDTVRLKKDHECIGLVDRTFANAETHTPDPLQDTLDGNIDKGENVDPQAFNEFLQSGIPPRGAVLVTWVFSPSNSGGVHDPVLISETELELLDRALMFGDVVKRSTQDPMSGIIIGATTTVSLLRPLSWPHDSSENLRYPTRQSTGNYVPTHANPASLLRNVSVDDLTWPNEIERDQIVIYNGWIGVVHEIEEDIYVRLDNNSVVIPEDCSLIRTSEDDSCQVNDRIKCRKSCLRRGRWIYGAYNADVSPEGVIVDMRPRTVSVDWLVCNRPYMNQLTPEQPPPEIERDELESSEFRIYDRRKTPTAARQRCNDPGHVPKNINLDISIGDRVRFKDLDAALAKYGDGDTPPSGGIHSSIRIPRTETLGYDVNVFTILESETRVDVLWQDGTTSKDALAIDICPYLDTDNEEEVWPGELVVSKEDRSTHPDKYKPVRAGIVQRVNAQDRLAYVKWFRKGNVTFSRDQPSYLLPDCRTSAVSDEISEVSLYDILTVPDFSRRLGDLVVIAPSDFTDRLLESNVKNFPGQEGVKIALGKIDDPSLQGSADISPASDLEEPVTWLGEVIELGLDGLLTVRLGAHDPPLDIRVPWECTVIAHSGDDHDDDLANETSDHILSDEESTSSMNGDFSVEIWRDEQGNEVPDNTGEWSTEDEDADGNENDADEASSTSSNEASEDEDVQMTDTPPWLPHESSIEADLSMEKPTFEVSAKGLGPSQTHLDEMKAFDYSSMFGGYAEEEAAEIGTETAKPLPFAVLDGSPPEDHHFANRPGLTGAKSLRRIQKEYQMLRESLPPGAYVRTWESRANLMRLLLLGPIDTPYEYAPFLFDFYMDSAFPFNPPHVYFHSWTNGDGPCNPNLYEDGKICLSLLGTWPGDDKNETWNPSKSSILQVIVSLLGLVLVKEPYYNEAGFEVRVGTAESRIPSAQYSERTYFRTRSFIGHVLRFPIVGFDDIVRKIYLGGEHTRNPRLLRHAIESGIDVIRRSKNSSSANLSEDKLRRVSAGAVVPLTRELERLAIILATHDATDAAWLRNALKELKP